MEAEAAMSKLSQIDGDTAKEKYDNAVKQYGVEKANKMLGDETLAQQMQSASTQEKFNASIEKLKDIFVTLIDPLMPVLNIFADILSIVGLLMVPIGWLSENFWRIWGKNLINDRSFRNSR
jgi:hypothetical protein